MKRRWLRCAAALALAACVAGPVAAAESVEACLASKVPTDQLNCLSRAVGPQGVSRELCRVHLAVAWQQPELCAGLAAPNLGDACYLQMAKAGADEALCARIGNAIIKSACGGE